MRVRPHDDLPGPLAVRLELLSATLTSVQPPSGEGRLRASLDAMTDDEAVAAAREIVDLWRALHVERCP